MNRFAGDPSGDLLDRLHDALRREPSGLSAEEIAGRFLHLTPSPSASDLALHLLKRDDRFRRLPAGTWTASESKAHELPLTDRLYVWVRSGPAGGAVDVGLFRPGFGNAERGGVCFAWRHRPGENIPADAESLAAGASPFIWSVAGPAGRLMEQSPIRLRPIAERLSGVSSLRDPSTLADFFGITYLESDRPDDRARLLARLHGELESRYGTEAVRAIGAPVVNRERPSFLSNIPEAPGVYRLWDEKKRLLYVGKSISLKRRLESWFDRQTELPESKQEMIARAADVTFEESGSEILALIIEARAIRRERPLYNEKIRIHTPERTRLDRGRRLFFVPHRNADYIMLVCTREDRALLLRAVRRNLKKTDGLTRSLRPFFYGSKGDPDDLAFALVARWYAEKGGQISSMDVGLAGNWSTFLAALVPALRDPELALPELEPGRQSYTVW